MSENMPTTTAVAKIRACEITGRGAKATRRRSDVEDLIALMEAGRMREAWQLAESYGFHAAGAAADRKALKRIEDIVIEWAS